MTGFINPSRDFSARRSSEQYIADVVDNNDPNQLGRIRVRILEIHGTQIPTGKLPWASPVYASDHGSINNAGRLIIPRIGSRVFVELYQGDVYSIFYIGTPRSNSRQVPSGLLEDYPNTYGYVDPNGNSFRIKLSDNSVQISLANGLALEIDGSGNVTINTPGNIEATSPQFTLNGNLQVNGNITASQNVTDATSSMQDMRDDYNPHTHPGGAGNPPNPQMT